MEPAFDRSWVVECIESGDVLTAVEYLIRLLSEDATPLLSVIQQLFDEDMVRHCANVPGDVRDVLMGLSLYQGTAHSPWVAQQVGRFWAIARSRTPDKLCGLTLTSLTILAALLARFGLRDGALQTTRFSTDGTERTGEPEEEDAEKTAKDSYNQRASLFFALFVNGVVPVIKDVAEWLCTLASPADKMAARVTLMTENVILVALEKSGSCLPFTDELKGCLEPNELAVNAAPGRTESFKYPEPPFRGDQDAFRNAVVQLHCDFEKTMSLRPEHQGSHFVYLLLYHRRYAASRLVTAIDSQADASPYAEDGSLPPPVSERGMTKSQKLEYRMRCAEAAQNFTAQTSLLLDDEKGEEYELCDEGSDSSVKLEREYVFCEEQWPLAGVLMVSYYVLEANFVHCVSLQPPPVMTTAYLFSELLPCFSQAFRNESLRIKGIGISLASHLVSRLPKYHLRMLDEEDNEDNDGPDDESASRPSLFCATSSFASYFAFAKDVITMLVTCASLDHRLAAQKLFLSYISLFGMRTRFKMLSSLMALSPFSSVTCMVLTLLKREIEQETEQMLSDPIQHSASCVFLSDGLPHMLNKACDTYAGNLAAYHEPLAMALNVWRFVLAVDWRIVQHRAVESNLFAYADGHPVRCVSACTEQGGKDKDALHVLKNTILKKVSSALNEQDEHGGDISMRARQIMNSVAARESQAAPLTALARFTLEESVVQLTSALKGVP